MQDTILTIDVGTGSTRVGLVDFRGNVIGFAQYEYDQVTPRAGWSEQPPSSWWNAACQGIRCLLQQHSEYRDRIAVIASCGQMHGTVLLNEAGELAVDQALLWNDKRNQAQVDAFCQQHSAEAFLSRLNNPPTTAWPAFKIAWIQENLPEVWQRVHTVLMPKDYINFQLTGQRGTDYSEASCFYLMDSHTLQYDADMLAQFGIRADQLPPIYPSQHILGTVHRAAAQLTGLPEGLPVVVGTADMAATLLGSGVCQPGVASDSTGTSTLLTVVAEQPLISLYLNNLHLANPVWGGFAILDAGGDAMRWARLAMHNNQVSYADMMQQAGQTLTGAEGLFFLPYLTGERNAKQKNSRAQFFGLTRKHRAGHLYRAILEGVALGCSLHLQQLEACSGPIERVIASGGGARDRLWLEIKAAIYQKPLVTTRSEENGTLGCAMIGATGVGLYASLTEATQAVIHFNEEILPDPQAMAYYQKALPIFRQLYQHSQAFYDELDALTI